MKRLSVVIPTYNRKQVLSQVLDSLSEIEIEFSTMEVVIIDDGSSDDTIGMLQARQDPFELRFYRYEKSQGPAMARNRGAQEAQGEILAFLDSDIIIDQNWWQAAKGHFENPEVAGVEGATVPFAANTPPTPFAHVVANISGNNFITCNMLYQRKNFLELGGFDKRFVKANREDSDLGFSFLEKGLKIIFEPDCIVRHPIVQASKAVYFKEARYGLHEALLRRKHPKLYKHYLKWIDGRAFPVFYWGIYFGLPLGILSAWQNNLWLLAIGLLSWSAGWLGSVYAVCRKRKTIITDLLILFPQYLLIPWIRLFWVLRGEWQYRHIKPNNS